MESIFIEATKSSPLVTFEPATDTLQISGESYPENSAKFYTPIFNWLDQYLLQEPPKPLTVDIQLVYFNSSSSKALMNLFDRLEEAAENGSSIVLNWRFNVEKRNHSGIRRRISGGFQRPAIQFAGNPGRIMMVVSDMSVEDLFSREKRIIDDAEKTTEPGILGDQDTARLFCGLLAQYKKLYKQVKRLIRASDRMQSDLNQLNARLRRSEEKYRNIFENAAEGIFQSHLDGAFFQSQSGHGPHIQIRYAR